MVLPLLLAVVVAMTWMLTVGLAQVRAVDAAREAARALARGDDPGLRRGSRRPGGAGGQQHRGRPGRRESPGDRAGHGPGPGGLLGALPGADVSATATALDEEQS